MGPSIGSTAGDRFGTELRDRAGDAALLTIRDTDANACGNRCNDTGDAAFRGAARLAGVRADPGLHHGVSVPDRADSAVGGILPQFGAGMGSLLGGRDGPPRDGVAALELRRFPDRGDA